MRSYGPTDWLDYYDTHGTFCAAFNQPESKLPDQLHSMLPCMLSTILLIALDGTLAACLNVHSQVSSEDPLNHTPKHPLKYIPNCTRWHPPSLLDCTLPSMLSRNTQEQLRVFTHVPLRVACKYTLKWKDTPNFTWLSARMYAPACSIQRLAELPMPATVRREAVGIWQV